MEISVSDYLAQLQADQVHAEQVTVTGAKVQQVKTIQAGLEYVIDQLDSGYLASYEWDVNLAHKMSAVIRLEANVINVPMSESERLLPKLIEGVDQPQAVNLYITIENDDVNRSGFRIDLLADEASLTSKKAADLVKPAQQWITDKLAAINENHQAAAEKAKKKSTKKTTAKKTTKKTTRKTSAKRTKRTKSSK